MAGSQTRACAPRVQRTTGEPEQGRGAPDPPMCLVLASRQGPHHALVDLFAARVTVLCGSGSSHRRLVDMALEATRGRWSAPQAVLAVDLDVPGVRRGSIDEALTELRAGPLVVVAARRPDGRTDTSIERLAAAVHGRSAAALLTDHLAVRAGLVLPATPPVSLGAVAQLAGPTAACDEGVEIAILGPVEVRGTDSFFARRPKLTELVVYLALHPQGATTASWSSALWPDRMVPEQTVANRLSEARRGLGFANDGRPRLRRDGDRHLLCGATTDWERFSRLAHHDHDPKSWHEALCLVRGRPFDGLLGRQWCVYDGLLSEIEVAISECATRLGQRLLHAGDPEGAQWAAMRALRACPFDERLHRLAMRAADAAGNRAGVEAVFRDLALKLELDGDARQRLHPQTVALYERLGGIALSAAQGTAGWAG